MVTGTDRYTLWSHSPSTHLHPLGAMASQATVWVVPMRPMAEAATDGSLVSSTCKYIHNMTTRRKGAMRIPGTVCVHVHAY